MPVRIAERGPAPVSALPKVIPTTMFAEDGAASVRETPSLSPLR
jgi:hypothetical protein